MPYRGGLRMRFRANAGRLPMVSAAITGGVPAGSMLTATATLLNVPKPASVTYTFQWFRNASGSNVGGTPVRTNSSQGLTDTYVTVDADVGNYIYVVITPANTKGSGTPGTSATIGAITAVAPVISSVSISGTIKEGQSLSAQVNYSTVGHPSPNVTYQWQYSTDGSTGWTNISGQNSQAYIVDIAYAGYFLRVNATADNSAGSSGPVSSPASARVDTLYFGDGSDGDVSIGSNTTISSSKKYRNLTFSATVTLAYQTGVANLLVQVARTFTPVAGCIVSADGGAGAIGQVISNANGTAVGGGGGVGGANGGGGGGSGGNATTNDSGSSFTYTNGNNGNAATGVSSDGDSQAGAAGVAAGGNGVNGVAGSNPASKSAIRDNTNNWGGGPGGGGGGGTASAIKGSYSTSGGVGGMGGGGFLRFLAQMIANTNATFQAITTGPGSASSNLYGGDGGGGRIAVGSYDTIGITMNVTPAAGKTGVNGTGTAGNTYQDTGVGD